MPLFVLVHSPSVGPSTWSPVAEQLVASGCDAVVPSLLSVGEGGPPFWPRAVAAVAAGLAGTDPGQPLVAARGHTPTTGEEFLPFLRSLADPDGRLPRWTDWWDEDDVAPMFPSPQAREVITGEQPRLPLAYYQEQVPAPAGWDDHSCGYLLFSPAYQDQARQARQRGWPVQSVPGEHLHEIVDPDGVAHALLDLAASTRS